jgi:thiamine transport system permease protein
LRNRASGANRLRRGWDLIAGKLVLWLPLAFLAAAFLYPLGTILWLSLGWGEGGVLAPFLQIVSDPYYLSRLWFTIWQAALSTVSALLVGLPAAYVFARYQFPGRSILLALTTIPFMMPPIVMALGFIALLGPTGLVNSVLMDAFNLSQPPLRILNSLWIILIAHVVYEFTIVVRLVSTLWANMDPHVTEAAHVLGASPARSFRRVTLPLLLPAVAAAATLVFLFTFTSFGVILILGGTEYATLEVVIYNLTAKLFRPPLAAALALTQMLVTFLVLAAYARLQDLATTQMPLSPRAESSLKNARGTDRLLILGGAAVVLLVVSPLVALATRSVLGPDGVSFSAYTAIFSNERNSFFFVSPLAAARNSLMFAFVTVLLAVPLGALAAYAVRPGGKGWWRSPVDAFYMLPLGVSAVTLGFGYLVSLRLGPIDLRTTWAPIVLAHVLIAYPFVMRVVLSTLRAIQPQVRDAARVLGAGPWHVLWNVELRITARALLVGGVFAFAVSMGEFGATLMLSRPEHTTMPVAIFRYLGQPGARNLAEALAMSSVLMLVAGLGFLLIERARYRGWGEF